MRHDPASAAVVVMLRGLKMYDLRPVSHPLLRGVRGLISDLMRPVFAMLFSWRTRWA